MPTVALFEEDEYDETIREFDERVRRYTEAPVMTPYVKAAAHYPPYLEHMGEEHLYVMPTRELPRQVKEMVAVGVSTVNACTYCIEAHAHGLQNMFDFTDPQLVELIAAVAHVSGLCRIETATMADDEPLFSPQDPDEVPLLAEIEATIGVLPEYYRIIARDEGFLEQVWEREKLTLLEGELDPVDKEFVAFGTAVANDAPYSTRFWKERLEVHGATEDEIFEALEVVEIFHKNNQFTTGLQLGHGSDIGGDE